MGLFDILKTSPAGKSDNPSLGDQLVTITDVISPSAININPRNISISGTNAHVFYAVTYPRYLNDGWMDPILNMSKEMDVSIFIHPVDTADTLKKFQKKVAEVQSQISIKEEKGEVRDPQLEAAYRNLEDLRDRLLQAEEKLFNVGFYLAIYSDNEANLMQIENEVRGVLDARLIGMKPALFQQEQGLKSIVPLADDQLQIHSKFNTEPLSSFFPFTSFDLRHWNPVRNQPTQFFNGSIRPL